MLLNNFRQLLVFASAVTFVVCLLAHLSTFCVDMMSVFPPVMLLHLLVLILTGFGIMVAPKQNNNNDGGSKKNFDHAPKGIKVMLGLFGLYALINFGIFICFQEGSPKALADGTYVLQNHGTVIRAITEQEFHLNQARVLRGFSGHWMAFSTAAMGLAWPLEGKDDQNTASS